MKVGHKTIDNRAISFSNIKLKNMSDKFYLFYMTEYFYKKKSTVTSNKLMIKQNLNKIMIS